MGRDAERALESVAVLGDNVRRSMYGFVRAARRPVSRDEVGAAAGTSRNLAAFHLDKLVDRGLLRATFEGAGNRRGAGRPAKLYQPAVEDVAVSLPERRYQLLGEILVSAVEEGGPRANRAAVATAAAQGRQLGEGRTTAGAEGGQVALDELLDELGFEPAPGIAGEIYLNNCPFRALALAAPEMVCGLNAALLTGVIEGLGATGVTAVLDPGPDRCCVVLHA
jgi:predicted ArsR family transcriptional regulator